MSSLYRQSRQLITQIMSSNDYLVHIHNTCPQSLLQNMPEEAWLVELTTNMHQKIKASYNICHQKNISIVNNYIKK